MGMVISVCDGNNCIQMFCVRDGAYMGAVMRQGEQRLRNPGKIEWCEATSSLVVAHIKENQQCISVMNVT